MVSYSSFVGKKKKENSYFFFFRNLGPKSVMWVFFLSRGRVVVVVAAFVIFFSVSSLLSILTLWSPDWGRDDRGGATQGGEGLVGGALPGGALGDAEPGGVVVGRLPLVLPLHFPERCLLVGPQVLPVHRILQVLLLQNKQLILTVQDGIVRSHDYDQIWVWISFSGELQIHLELRHDGLDPSTATTDDHGVNTVVNLNLLLGHRLVFMDDGFDSLDGRVDVGLVAGDGDPAGLRVVSLGQLDVDGVVLPQLGDLGALASDDLGMVLRVDLDGALEAAQLLVLQLDLDFFHSPTQALLGRGHVVGSSGHNDDG